MKRILAPRVAERIGVVGLITVCACAATRTAEYDYAPYATVSEQPVFSLSATLQLDESLQDYTYCMELGDTLNFPLNGIMAQNAEVLARSLCEKVVVVTTPTSGIGQDLTDLTMVPRVVSIDRLFHGQWASSDVDTTISIEWTLTDRVGETVWLGTVHGTTRGETGNVFSIKRKSCAQLQDALKDVFKRSFQRMSTAPEITAFERKVYSTRDEAEAAE